MNIFITLGSQFEQINSVYFLILSGACGTALALYLTYRKRCCTGLVCQIHLWINRVCYDES